MIDPKQLLKDLQKRVTLLEDDMRARCNAQPEVDAPLRQEYEAAREKGRTGLTYNAWRDEELTQIAVAWILAGVFVRFLEDNELVEVPLIAGGNATRHQRAQDEHSLFFRQHPTASERDYFEQVFAQVGKLPGMKDFFDRRHNPLWRVGPTADAAKDLLEFWRKSDPDTGRIVFDFCCGEDQPTSPRPSPPYQGGEGEAAARAAVISAESKTVRRDSLSVPSGEGEGRGEVGENSLNSQPSTLNSSDPTRFLGDLYQDLSEAARKRFALLQTPVFVEEFILDRTLTPAIATFGYKVVRMIDPTCGSGHFCLGGFERLFALWQRENPGENPRVLAQRALDGVAGVDLNPYAVAIARFRLLLAALRVCGVRRLKDAPDFKIHLAVGDSLLHGPEPGVVMDRNALKLRIESTVGAYQSEDADALADILSRHYHAVVGNPPYITVKDKRLNVAYREIFGSCHRKYSLAAPFMERFFDLAVQGSAGSPLGGSPELPLGMATEELGEQPRPAGCVGMITANSFMKREFGKKLIEDFFPRWDITHVVDTGGAHIPEHGTPTVILLGKNQRPIGETIRTVLGIRSEASKPADPAQGFVWRAICEQIDHPGSTSEWVSASDSPRLKFSKHPWSIGGGGAAELQDQLDEAGEKKLSSLLRVIGVFGMTNCDEVFVSESSFYRRACLPASLFRPFITGEQIRDWQIKEADYAFFPYEKQLVGLEALGHFYRSVWQQRIILGSRATFSKRTYFAEGRPWWEWHQVVLDRLEPPLTITFTNVATHNHFALEHGDHVFNSHSPLMKLSDGSNAEAHAHLLGILNSSVSCFWLRQVSFPKGGSGIGRGIQSEQWESRYEFDSTKLASFPLPPSQPAQLPTALVQTSTALQGRSPASTLASWGGSEIEDLWTRLASARELAAQHRRQLIAWQEELDWQIYEAFGLIGPTEAVSQPEGHVAIPPESLELGQRAFEIVMARRLAAGELQTTWFERHGSTPITELPAQWPAPYRELVQRRIALIESDRNIALIEQPEYKRRWNVEPWDKQLERALREWLLNRLEAYFFGGERVAQASSPAGSGGVPAASSDSGQGCPENSQAGSPRYIAHGFPAAMQPALVSTNQLAAVVETDADFLRLAEIYTGGPGFSVSKLVRELVEAESVPFLPFQRYKDTGLRKRQDWEHVWELQRREDAVEAEVRSQESGGSEEAITAMIKKRQKAETGEIPVPPKYTAADFKKSHSWKLRGKLDVPKERWVIYPGAEREGDPSPIIAWAGWDHLQQAKALAAYYVDASTNLGWTPDRLQLLLAGLADLLPWLRQWHNDFDPEVGSGLGDFFAGFLDEEAHKQSTTIESLNRLRFGEERTQASHPLEGSAPESKPVRRSIRREQPTERSSPASAAFAQAYPSTPADRLVCSLALELVAWRDPIDSNDHLDALILATYADIRRVFANATNPSSLDAWARAVKAQISVIALEGLKWVQCLSYLETHRMALEISRTQVGRPIRAGSAFEEVRKELAVSNDGVALSILAILDEMKAVRGHLDLSAEQTAALRTLQELHARNALAMEEP